MVVADLNAGPAEAVAGRLAGGGHLGLAMDVADTDDVVRGVAQVAGELGPVDILVNVAGWDRFVPFVETTREFWDQVIAVNYRGPLNTTHAVLPSMIERRRGRHRVGGVGRRPGRLVAGVDLLRREGRRRRLFEERRS